MFRAFTLFISILLSLLGRAQTIQILDADDRMPIAGAYVNGQLPVDYVETNDEGYADVAPLSKYDTLTITFIGYPDTKVLNDFNTDQINIISLRSGITFDDDILIIARAPNQKRSDLPAYIETLRAEQIRSSHPQTAADYVSQANGVFLQKSQLGGGSPLIRGFAANRILLVVDGVRMNNAIFRSGNLQNIISVDPNSLDRVHILLGPNSLKYGSDALGGVISMETMPPQYAPNISGHISAQYHSANQEKTSSLSLNYRHKKWAWRGGVSYSDFGDLVMGSHGPDSYLRDSVQLPQIVNGQLADAVQKNDNPKKQVATGYRQLFTQQQLSYQINEDQLLNYSFYFSQSSDVPRYDRLIQKSGDTLRHAEWYYGPQKWMMHRLHYSINSEKKIFNYLSIGGAYQAYQESRHDRRFNNSSLRNRTEQLNIYSLNIDASKNIGKHKLSYGTEWIYNKVSSSAYVQDIVSKDVADIQTRYPDQSTMQSSAFYMQLVVALSSKVSLSGGLRYTYTDLHAPISDEFIQLPFSAIDLSTSNLSSSLGLSYIPKENIFFYANLSTGFRTPNVDDVGKVFDSEPGNVVVPNGDLQPEKVYSAEVGIESRYSQGFNYHLGAYFMHLEDIISRQDFSFNGEDSIVYDGLLSKVQSLQNADNGYIYGFEGKLKYSFNQNWSSSLQMSYQSGKEKINGEDKPLRHIAPLFGNFNVTYKKDRYSIISLFRYNHYVAFNNLADTERAKPYIYASDINGDPYSPAWFTWNLKAEVNIKKVTINVGADNILDKRYRPYSSGIVSARRSVVVAGRLKF